MGCLFAALLAESGADVALIDYRPERASLIDARGVIVEEAGAERSVSVRASADPAAAGTADGVIFMVKAHATEGAALRLAGSIAPGAWVMSLQNGMGNVEALAAAFGADRTLAGVTSQGATLKDAGSIRRAGLGETFIGELDGAMTERIETLAAVFAAAGIPAEASRDVNALLWRKLLVNAGINPLTALLRISNGEILERPEARETLEAAVAEAAAVARAAGVDIGVPDAVALVEEVARRTAGNISSMHQDVLDGRRTEIDFICGAVVREGERLGVPTPVNRILRFLIQAMTEPAQR